MAARPGGFLRAAGWMIVANLAVAPVLGLLAVPVAGFWGWLGYLALSLVGMLFYVVPMLFLPWLGVHWVGSGVVGAGAASLFALFLMTKGSPGDILWPFLALAAAHGFLVGALYAFLAGPRRAQA